tara:strand:- start:1456 stop:1731 length:276 start_codon:yes stop_codon:yes gene_type:complete
MNSNTHAIINYCLNRFCPWVIILTLISTSLELTDWRPYVIIGLIFFMDRFQFKVGYSVGYCEANGIDPTKPGIMKKRKKNIQTTDKEVDDR